MVPSKKYIILTIFILLIISIFTSCDVSENVSTNSVRTLKQDIHKTSDLVKNVDVYRAGGPTLWYKISFSEEPSKEIFDEVFNKIKEFSTKSNIEEINKGLKRGSVANLVAVFDINNDGNSDYRFDCTLNLGWYSFETPMGNSNSNLINGDGIVAVDNYSPLSIEVESADYIYYVNYKDENKLYKMHADGKDNSKVIDEPVSKISVVGDFIYYIDKQGYICKFDKHNNSKLTILKEKCTEYVVSGYWIYYTQDRISGINRIRTDGNFKELLVNESGYDLCILKNDFLYYVGKPSNSNPNNSINIIDVNTNKKVTFDYNATQLVCDNQGSLYYLDGSENNHLYVLYYDPYRPNEGEKNLKLTDDAVGSFNWIDGGICYENLSDNSTLYKVSWDGTERVKLINERCSKISSIYEIIYYLNDNTELVQYNEESKDRNIIY